jgi:hypothetical protein
MSVIKYVSCVVISKGTYNRNSNNVCNAYIIFLLLISALLVIAAVTDIWLWDSDLWLFHSTLY